MHALCSGISKAPTHLCSSSRTRVPISCTHHLLCPRTTFSSSSSRLMMSGGSPASSSNSSLLQPQRRALSVSALFSGFKWPFGGEAQGATGRARKRGCELAPKDAPEGLKLATFGGGCFWGLELAFQRVAGVVKTSVGYTGGHMEHPTYDEVCMGSTGHAEVVQVTYDPQKVTYRQLLDVFFGRVDPTTLNRQGNDRGTQYRSAIYTHDLQQQQDAQEKIAEVDTQLQQGVAGKWLGRKVVTTVEPCGDYYLAEKYHQQYLERGGRFGTPQSAAKGCKDTIRCYG